MISNYYFYLCICSNIFFLLQHLIYERKQIWATRFIFVWSKDNSTLIPKVPKDILEQQALQSGISNPSSQRVLVGEYFGVTDPARSRTLQEIQWMLWPKVVTILKISLCIHPLWYTALITPEKASVISCWFIFLRGNIIIGGIIRNSADRLKVSSRHLNILNEQMLASILLVQLKGRKYWKLWPNKLLDNNSSKGYSSKYWNSN